jgi:hypothetical protein
MPVHGRWPPTLQPTEKGIRDWEMRKPKQEKTAWTISRLRTMPPELFYGAIASVYSGHRSVSSTARMLLAQRDRGGLQSATFHTLRTYLTSLHKLLKGWLRSFPNVGPLPCILQETVDWLKGINEREQRSPREAI